MKSHLLKKQLKLGEQEKFDLYDLVGKFGFETIDKLFGEFVISHIDCKDVLEETFRPYWLDFATFDECVKDFEEITDSGYDHFVNTFLIDVDEKDINDFIAKQLSIDKDKVEIYEFSGFVRENSHSWYDQLREMFKEAFIELYADKFEPKLPSMYDLPDHDEVNDEYILKNHPDAEERDGVFVDIDGKVYFDKDENKTHSELVGEVFNKELEQARSNAIKLLEDENVERVAFGHLLGKDVLIDEPTNMSFEDVVNDLKASDLQFDRIYAYLNDWDEDEGLIKRLAKKVDKKS